MNASRKYHIWEVAFGSIRFVAKRNLDVQLARFLRQQRGEMSYVQFAKKIGVGHMTARRLESGEHHITLNKLETILDKLKVKLSDIFPAEF
jgi:transcriptional regulator with XRE-family HTH domain